jgi:glycosyltransferase involved in cell wall biosynthesis
MSIKVNSKVNVGYLGNQIAPGGGSASLMLMLKSLDDKNFNKYVLSSECSNVETRKLFEKHACVVKVDNKIRQFVSCAGTRPSFVKYIINYFTSKKQADIVVDFIIKYNIEILHVNNSVFSHLYQYIKSRISIKIVTHVREQVDLYSRKYFEKFIVDNINYYSDVIVAISENECRPFDKKKCIILENPYDFAANSNQSLSNKSLIRSGNEILIAIMGRFSEDKGHLVFLKALKELLYSDNNLPDFKFVMIGVGDYLPLWKRIAVLIIKRRKDYRWLVEKYIASNGLEKYVVRVPYIDNVIPLIADIDIYVRASLFGDPWGRDIIEAMAMSKPVVATGDSQVFVSDNINGYLVPVMSPDIMANKIMLLICDKLKRQEFGKNGYLVVKSKCDINNYSENISNIYKRAMHMT